MAEQFSSEKCWSSYSTMISMCLVVVAAMKSGNNNLKLIIVVESNFNP